MSINTLHKEDDDDGNNNNNNNNKFHPVTCYEAVEGSQSYSSTRTLTSGLYEGEWSTPDPGSSTPAEISVLIIRGGFVGSIATLDVCE